MLSIKFVESDYYCPRRTTPVDFPAVSATCSDFFLIFAGCLCDCFRGTKKHRLHTGLSTKKKTYQLTISTFILAFSVSGIFIAQAHTMDPYPLPNSRSALASISKGSVTTLALQAVAFSRGNEKATAERNVSAVKVTGPAAGIMTNSYTLPHLSFSSQWLTEDLDGTDFLRRLYARLHYWLAGLYASVTSELQAIRGELASLMNEPVSLPMDGQY